MALDCDDAGAVPMVTAESVDEVLTTCRSWLLLLLLLELELELLSSLRRLAPLPPVDEDG